MNSANTLKMQLQKAKAYFIVFIVMVTSCLSGCDKSSQQAFEESLKDITKDALSDILYNEIQSIKNSFKNKIENILPKKEKSFVAIRDVADKEGIEVYWDAGSKTVILDTGLCYTVGINETYIGEDGEMYVQLPPSGDTVDLVFSPSHAREDWVSYAGYFITGLGVYYAGVGLVKVGSGVASTLAPAAPLIAAISKKTQEHIMQPKHAWKAVVRNADDWKQIKVVIDKVMENGTQSSYGSALQKTYQVSNHVVTVTYQIVNGVIRISNAWVIMQ